MALLGSSNSSQPSMSMFSTLDILEAAQALLNLSASPSPPREVLVTSPSAVSSSSSELGSNIDFRKGNSRFNMDVLRVTSGPCKMTKPKSPIRVPVKYGCIVKGGKKFRHIEPKNKPNLYTQYQMEQKQWLKTKPTNDHSNENNTQVNEAKTTCEVSTQTEEEYTPPEKVHELENRIELLTTEVKFLRLKLFKYVNNAVVNQSDSFDNKADKVAVADSTKETETKPAVSERSDNTASSTPNKTKRRSYERKSKMSESNMSLTESEMQYDEATDDDSDYEAAVSEVEEEEDDMDISDDEVTSPNKSNKNNGHADGNLVPIGDGNAVVPARLLKQLNWKSYTSVTRKLLTAVFSRSVLATHSLTGKPSPAFPDKPAKKKLDPVLVNDIVQTVVEGCHVTETLVRTSITTKCADESKMLRSRLQNKKKRRTSKKENKPPRSSNSSGSRG